MRIEFLYDMIICY